MLLWLIAFCKFHLTKRLKVIKIKKSGVSPTKVSQHTKPFGRANDTAAIKQDCPLAGAFLF